MAVLSIGQVWADDPTITEDFELQTAGSTYNSHYSYEADDSNAGIAWYVEHGVVSTNSKLSGEKSMQMRAYYAKNSAASALNGALPYLESRTAVKGLKSITLKIAAATTLKIDILYSTNGTSWSPMKTDAATPADATSQTYTTSAATKTYNIPSSDVNTSYYIKFEVNSSSTHTANPGSTGNLVFRVDDIVFTYAVPAPSFTITAESNNTSYGSVALVGTTITATPETGYRISTSEPYSVAPANSATVAQNNNAFTVTPSANTTVTINFEAIPTYKVSFSTGTGNPSQDPITETLGGQGITLPDGPEPTCSTDGWEFAGWAEAPVNSQTTTAPTFLSGTYHPTANCTLYAVYKKSDSGSVIDQNVKETFENQTAGTTYNQTQTYTAANSNAGIAWSMYYGTVSTNDKIAGSNSAQMRWYSSATSSLGYIKTTTPISGLQSIDFKARVSTTDVKMSVWYSTNGEDWTLKDENLTFSAASSGLPFSSTINGTIGTDYYIKIGVGDGGTAPSSGSYKLIIDEVQFNYQAGAITTYYLSAPSCDVPTCSTPTISPNSGNFYGESQEVTIECTTEGASIYYIINGDDPTNGTLYEEPFSVTETSTVKAIAIKSGMNNSPIAEKTYTKIVPLATMADVQAAATSTDESTITVSIANWVVTAVSGSQVWFTAPDNLKGILLYNSGHGFTTGKKLNGLVIDTKVKLYNLYPELTSLAASNVDVTDADEVAARTTTIAALTSGHPAEQGTIVKLEGVTYSSSVLSDGVNSIAADNKFYSSLALIEGTTYDITGVVTYYKNGDNAVVKIAPRNADDVEAQTPVVIPTAANLAALKDADRGTYILTLDHAVVTYVNGKNAFIEDATAGALIFIQNHGYNAGDCLTGDYQVTTEDYQGKFEITAMEAQTGAEKTSGAEIPVTTLTIAQLNANFAANESKRIKIVGANVTDAISGSDRNGAINDGAALAVYAAAASTITLTLNDNVDIIGYPGFHNTDQQLNVWATADITVNEKDPAGIAFNPESATYTPGVDEWSAPAFANPNTLDVTFSSDAEGVATVSNAGVVSLAGGYGTAVITAHTNGDATHNAGNATYTITVIDPSTVDTRHVANGPTAFTTTSGNLTPDDIAYAAYIGGASTAPGIYNDGIRLYQISGSNDFGGFVTITAKAGCTIDEVQITTTSKYATTVAYSKDGNENLLKSESVAKSGSYTTGTGLNVSSVNILNLGTGSDGRLEIASIKVYYTGEAATIDHYELGGTYQTAFMQDDEFNHTGLIVYAAYDALGENKVDITSMCTFSDPDMSTTGDKTIEITYNEAVVTSYTINVAADSRKVANSPATFTTVSGDMTPNDISFASYQGGANNPPANYNDGIRLYQAPSGDAIGGYITLKAKKGCTIDQVKITTTNTYATTVAYSVDGNANLLGEGNVAKSGEYSTPSGLDKESVNIVNKGTGSNGRLEIASITVWYSGDPLSVDHYILGGTYETVFEQFGTFSYEGLTVTASYDAGETITEAVTGFTVEADLSTAGVKKAEVMLNSVKIAEYDITVTASEKEDPALAYSPASVILAFGQSLSAPEFSNTYNVSPITYSSDKKAVATVDAEGNISLAGGTGVAVITASFAGDDNYIASEATFTITVNEPVEDLSGTWVKATSVAAGDRIIVGATVSAGTKTMGKQNSNPNRAAVASTLADGVLTPGEETKTFLLVDAGDGKFALQGLNGKYLTSATEGTNNSLLEAANYDLDNAKWTITIDGEGVASVVAAAGSRTYMQYNNGSTLFSCYQYATSQSPINIYKKATKEIVRDGLSNGKWGTLCPTQNISEVEGAEFFQISHLEEDEFENPYNMVFDQIEGTTLTAGKPYFFIATGEEIRGIKTGAVLDEADQAGVNGFYGYIGATPMDLTWRADYDGNENNTFVIYQNSVFRITGDTQLKSERCYININSTEPSRSVSQPAPGRRRINMAVSGTQVATGIDAINASEAPVKMMIDGQLYILRGEKMYDTTGRLVK